jgi:hypothetical protein
MHVRDLALLPHAHQFVLARDLRFIEPEVDIRLAPVIDAPEVKLTSGKGAMNEDEDTPLGFEDARMMRMGGCLGASV